ncbi:MAG: hypothetical protein C0394_10790 [Syntrophus sp. (in: bacteria)]|nr:hypothetical protein [Syntrophus sp. (in: bacteria)]
MRFTDKDRRELINKLKKVRDPRERDKIMWALAGQEEAVFHNAPAPAKPYKTVPQQKPAPRRPAPEKPIPEKTPDLRNIPPLNIDAKRMLGFAVPVFFVIFGLFRLGQAALNYIASQDINAEIQGLITGGIFLIIGLAGVFRAMQPPQVKQEESS